MISCWRVLKPGGVLLVSVPDASYFRKVHDEDTVENAERLFGEPIHLPDGETTFFGYGLWNRWHKAILTEDALWAYFVRAGFKDVMTLMRTYLEHVQQSETANGTMENMVKQLNRIPFSLVMCAVKE
jgi:predicted SAM-dependent methyltransferase